jgi:hypothetical protein
LPGAPHRAFLEIVAASTERTNPNVRTDKKRMTGDYESNHSAMITFLEKKYTVDIYLS